MKPFNLEEAKAGKKVITRDGREYKFGAHNPEAHPGHEVMGWVDGKCETHFELGMWDKEETEMDLFMAEEEMWVNVYETDENTGEYFIGIRVFENEEEAKKSCADSNYIKTIRLKP